MSVTCVDYETCPDCHGIGEDDNARFYCSTCKRTGSIPATLRHYEVISPEMVEYHQSWDPPEPPDHYRCWGLYLAKNKRDAIKQAAKDEAFRDWVTEARGDRVPPFKGLVANLTLCEHGICWACGQDEEGLPTCPECLAALSESERKSLSLEFMA